MLYYAFLRYNPFATTSLIDLLLTPRGRWQYFLRVPTHEPLAEIELLRVWNYLLGDRERWSLFGGGGLSPEQGRYEM